MFISLFLCFTFLTGLEDLFSTLQHIKTQLNTSEDKSQVSILQHLFNNPQFRKAVQIHNKIIQVTSRSTVYSSECSNALQTSNEVMTVLQHTPSPYASDLTEILATSGFKVRFYLVKSDWLLILDLVKNQLHMV